MKTITILKQIKTTAAKTVLFTVIVFLFISMFGQNVMSQTISGVSTSIFVDGESIVVSGSGFGSNELNIDFLTFEGGVAGSPFSETGWEAFGESNNFRVPRYSNVEKHHGSNSMLCDFPITHYGSVFHKNNGTAISKAYVTFWIYLDYDLVAINDDVDCDCDGITIGDPDDYCFQHKIWRINPQESVTDCPSTFYMSIWPRSTTVGVPDLCYQAMHVNSPDGVNVVVPDGNFWRSCWSNGEWLKVELFLEEESGDGAGTADGTEIVKYYKTSTSSWTTWSDYGGNVDTRIDNAHWQWIHFGQYIGNTSTTIDANIYYDDVFVQTATWARIEIGDNSSWNDCAHREIQIPTAWSDDSITVTVNQGSFQDGETAYLFVIDENGTVSEGCPITFYLETGAYTVDLKVFLEGPFNETDMNTDLNPVFIPLSQPYNIAPWNYAGTESVVSIPNANIVDWVLIELRDTTEAQYATGSTMIARQAAFLLNDGSIVGMDGSSILSFNHSIIQSLFVVIWHRNHLGVLSANALSEFGDVYFYNFTTGANKAYGGANGHKEIVTGIWGMVASDGNADGTVDILDMDDVWKQQAGKKGYKPGDYYLNGQVNNPDKNDIWFINIGSESQVPE